VVIPPKLAKQWGNIRCVFGLDFLTVLALIVCT
jgi:hypothetical protein